MIFGIGLAEKKMPASGFVSALVRPLENTP